MFFVEYQCICCLLSISQKAVFFYFSEWVKLAATLHYLAHADLSIGYFKYNCKCCILE